MFTKVTLLMVIDKEMVCILGLTKVITMDNGKMIE